MRISHWKRLEIDMRVNFPSLASIPFLFQCKLKINLTYSKLSRTNQQSRHYTHYYWLSPNPPSAPSPTPISYTSAPPWRRLRVRAITRLSLHSFQACIPWWICRELRRRWTIRAIGTYTGGRMACCKFPLERRGWRCWIWRGRSFQRGGWTSWSKSK